MKGETSVRLCAQLNVNPLKKIEGKQITTQEKTSIITSTVAAIAALSIQNKARINFPLGFYDLLLNGRHLWARLWPLVSFLRISFNFTHSSGNTPFITSMSEFFHSVADAKLN